MTALTATSYGLGLFTDARYLDALQRSGCVGPHEGWRPAPIVLDGIGHAPCYEKDHSWGEFVFDFQIAQAYAQHGLDYYPKLVCCVPYTPVPGPRLLARDASGRRALADAMIEHAQQQQLSSAHILYLPGNEADELAAHWLRRVQPRYVWRNPQGWKDFDGFLDALPGKLRKNIRRERRLVAEAGLVIEWRRADAIDPTEWPRLYALYASTYQRRGQAPYLNLECLRLWAATFGERLQFCIARGAHDGEAVALAFFFEEGDSLYGRHWGTSRQIDGLHFELCYYQGIERCLARGLTHFDAGVQGEHKRTRGFSLELAHSAHWFAHPGFRAAIAPAFAQERSALLQALAQPQ